MVERADNQSLPQAEGRHVDGEEPCVTLDAFLEQSNATAVRLEPDEDGVVDAIERVTDKYLSERTEGERFVDPFRRVGMAPFKEAIYG